MEDDCARCGWSEYAHKHQPSKTCGDFKTDEPCLSDGTPFYPRRKPTREERLQGLADRGVDTWEEYRGER